MNPALDPVIRSPAAKFFFHDPGADFLHPMADTDGENQKRRQNVHGIETVAQQAQDTHLPDHGYQ